MAQTFLPPGFRFHPTDIELVSYYLKRKIMGKKLLVQAISEVELYKFAPWDLPDKSCLRSKDLEWFFFCPRDKKYPNGSRTNRGTPNGYWKTSGKDRTIELNSRVVGSKKTLIFHEGKAPNGTRTDWVMYEYKMEDANLVSAGFSKDAYVLCKIFKKSGLGPRIGEQYGAPFNEDEWENADAETSMFPLMSSSGLVNSADYPHVQNAATTGAVEQPSVHHSSAACAQKESSSEHITATNVEDLGHVTADCALQELPSQLTVNSSGDVVVSEYNCSNEVNIVYSPPEIDRDILEELSRFLNDSPHHNSPIAEHSGLPPMSELEAQALEINNCGLYNELAGLAGTLGGASNADGFCASNLDIADHTFEPMFNGIASSDDFIGLDDLLTPGATFYELPVPTFSYESPVPRNQFSQYPLDRSIPDGHYDDVATISAGFPTSDSLPRMPSIADDLPTIASTDDFATCFVGNNYADPQTMRYPFS